MPNMTEEEQKTANLQKWQEFKDKQAFEQELASKQAFFGRGGDPMGVRYNVHDGGEMPEWYTQDVIATYAGEEGMVYHHGKKLCKERRTVCSNKIITAPIGPIMFKVVIQ